MSEPVPKNEMGTETVRELERPGNRVLGLSEYGNPNGLPVLAFHGIPGTRLMFRPTDEIAARLGLRIIAPDRPGFGCSTPQPCRQLQDWIPEVETILSAYNIDRFALIGISGGSPFATATAAHFGNRVASMILFGPMGPVTELEAGKLHWLHRNFFLRLAKTPAGLRALLTPANVLFRLSPSVKYSVFLKLIPLCDQKIMRDRGRRAQIIRDVRESLAQGGEGMRSDLRIYSQPWNVRYGDIKAPTTLWQGLDDNIVPIQAALLLGDLIPACIVHRIPQAGHFWIYEHIELVLTTLRDTALSNTTS